MTTYAPDGKRIAPSPELIAQAVRDAPDRHQHATRDPDGRICWGKPAEALSMRDAINAVRAAHRTTHAKAREWLWAASAAGAVFVCRAGTYGTIGEVLGAHPNSQPGGAAYQWNWTTNHPHLTVADGVTSMDSPQLSDTGCHVTGDEEREVSRKDRWAPARSEWVVLPEVYAAMMAAERDQRAADAVHREAEKVLEQVVAEDHYGDSIAMLRGLLHTALVPVNDNTLRVRSFTVTRKGHERVETFAELTLRGPYLDRVAEMLRAAGVQPRTAVEDQ